MTLAGQELKLKEIRVRITQEVFPPYHHMHGTPDPVVQRVFAFEFPQGAAELDQTDYGHPGRFNACHVRQVPPNLQSMTEKITAAAESLSALLD